ncbi:MAG: cation transporter [Candidatus Symbiothrix sp.]|jgi:Cu(I)/Ag(I) efflux system membrane fusion protein|nr:cation transporter [Candidatus Symbiothrix sp.]
MKKTILFVAAIAWMAAISACSNTGKNAHNQGETTIVETQVADTQIDLKVQGACEMCKERIEKAAGEVPGVSSATWDLETKELHLNFDPDKTNPDAIAKAIAKAGHDTDNYKADDAVYNALPHCCHYRG